MALKLKHLPLVIIQLIASGAFLPAHAQENTNVANEQVQKQDSDKTAAIQKVEKIQRVEVTGSNIKRVDIETASPVQVITRADIEKSGATSLSAVIQNISSNNTGALTGVEFNGFSPGATTASLRGLGSGATLVLVNGRRIAQYGITGFQSQFANLDSIPLGAVDHIDILLDGASAIYGSEAIAGVINITLRSDYTGGEVRVGGGLTQTGKNGSDHVGVGYGKGDIIADKYNVFGTFEHDDTEALSMRDINTYNSSDYRGLGFTKGDRRSAYSYPGNIVGPGGIKALPGCDPSEISATGRCLLDRFDYTDAIPKNKRDSLFGRGVYEISSDHSAFLEAGVTRITTNLRFDPQFYYNSGSFLSAGGNNYLYRAGDLGSRRFDVADTEVRLVGGFKGTVKGWDYDTAVGFLQSKVSVGARGLILTDQMEAALADGSYVPGGSNAASVLQRISPTLTRYGSDKSEFADFKISNSDLFSLPGGSAGIAAGVEYHSETSTDVDDPAYQAGNVFGFGGLPALPPTTRSSFSGYSEFTLPVVQSVELSAAARADHYSVGGNSLTPKLGIKWNALSTLVLRGTLSHGFRAPNFREISPATSLAYYNGLTDPLLCKTGNEPDCNLSFQANISGNPNLLPEKSNSKTAGLVWEPVKDMSVSLDYFQIERRNEITSLDINYLLANQLDPNFAQFITRDAGGHITSVALPYINIGRTKVSGYDLDLKGKKNLGEWGKLNVHSTMSLNREYDSTPFPNSPTVDYNKTYDQPAFRSSLAVGWEKGPWTHEASTNYVSGYGYNASPADSCNIDKIFGAPLSYCHIGSNQTYNWFTGYKGFKNVELTLNIQNLFNTSPSFDARSALANGSFPYNPDYSSPLGRRYAVMAKYTFQ